MQFFGLLGLIITIAIAAWWLTSARPMGDDEKSDTQASYQESINAAEEAAELLGN